MITTWTNSRYDSAAGCWVRTRENERTSHEGAVLEVSGHEIRIMSDVWAWETYAVVWDDAAGKPVNVPVCNDSDLSTGTGTATVDATPERVAAYTAYKARVEAERVAAEAHAARAYVTNGKVVKVVTGREKGAVGLVFWIGTSSSRYATTRCGIATTTRKNVGGQYMDVVWTATSNVAVVGVESTEAMEAATAAFMRGEVVVPPPVVAPKAKRVRRSSATNA